MGTRRAFVISALSELSRRNSFGEVPEKLGMDAFLHGKKGEEGYAAWLAEVEQSSVDSLAGRNDSDDRAICFAMLQLRVHSRYLKKLNS